MQYTAEAKLKDGRALLLKSGGANDGEASLEVFIKTHRETDFLLAYPDEISYTAEQQAKFLQKKYDNPREIELIAYVDSKPVGLAGLDAKGSRYKLSHRVELGVCVCRDYWGLGIGRALCEACIECARQAGYRQIELEVSAENTAAIILYKKLGFVEYGRNPQGFFCRDRGAVAMVEMLKEL